MQPADAAPAERSAVSATRVWLGLALALAAYAALIVMGLRSRASLTPPQLTDPARLLSWWSPLMGLGVIGIVAFIEHAPLTSLGLRRPRLIDLDWGLLFFAVGFAAMVRIGPMVNSYVPGVGVRMREVSMLEGWTMVLSSATMEELFFRGYLLERLERVSGRTWIAALASLIMFAFGHLAAWGPAGVVRNLVWGAFITLLYVWRRNLPTCMMMHLLQNAGSLPGLWYLPLRHAFRRGAL
ncbi:MAG TPA: CPBP family intramembrane glutamic endopeptidase [Candidatus Binataceae bacterium]|nr:CPBP family intramembrane glutamic endopeptidase [Candidatus Binataceae bacterium]